MTAALRSAARAVRPGDADRRLIGAARDGERRVEYAKTLRRLSVEAYEKFGVPTTGDGWVESYEYVYKPLEERYGGYHGFQEEAFFVIARAFSGAVLGY